MPINFPNAPSLNQVYTFNGRSWEWTGVAWKSVTAAYGPTGPTGAASTVTGPTGIQGVTGANSVVFQAGTPSVTTVLWYDTDETAVVAVPSGGTIGQVLTKIDSTDYNTQWSSGLDITPLDNIKSRFNGSQTRFLPTYLGNTVAITNPYRLFLNINGIVQLIEYPDLVWGSPLPRQGFWVDDDGYIVFSEAPLPGSTFDARMMAGTTTTTKTKLLYPFEAADILLGE